MRTRACYSLVVVALAAACAAGAASSAAAAGGFGVEKFLAGTCTVPTCSESSSLSELFTQAAAHPNYGITDFKFNTTGTPPLAEPEGNVRNVRVDTPPGLSVNPQAVPECPAASFEENACPETTRIGTDELTVFVPLPLLGADLTIPAGVYNLERPLGVPAEFGVEVTVATLKKQVYLEGGISWSSDYHEFFTIRNISNELPLIESRLIFEGQKGTGFLTTPSACSGPQTTFLEVESYAGEKEKRHFTTPIGATGCNLVPFAPTIGVTPATTQSDRPDGASVEVKVPQDSNPADINSSTLHTAVVTLPEGMTINPSAAHGLEGCTPAQIGIGTTAPVVCPAASKIGKVTIETPTLPPGALTGSIYLGKPESGSITGPPYTIYLDAESERYGVSTRLAGTVLPDAVTGQLKTTFAENPQVPFSDLIMTFTGGALAPLANPLQCGSASTTSSLTPYSAPASAATPASAFTVDFDAHGAPCPAPLPFSLSEGTSITPATAGAKSSFVLSLARADGQQYVSHVSATLPPGLVGLIPSVPLCGEPQAAAGTCTQTSEIGVAAVQVGAGPTPTQFGGRVYLTGPYGGAPYGLAIVVPVVTGPFDLGTEVVRAGVAINPFTARVTIGAAVPTIRAGIPLRLKNVTVAVNRQNFLVNPTNCGALATETTLTSTLGATQTVSSPFQVGSCNALGFKPSFSASAGGKTSKANGASLKVKIGYPSGAQANIKSVLAQLPKQLPSRLTTLQKACPEATFNANPFACPKGSRVGGATVTTPVLPGKLTGPAFFVSHGGAAFPDLDLVLVGANDVEVILVGNTNITGKITTSNFATIPDVPVSSFELNLPVGPNSALAANGNLCAAAPLSMPTTLTAQNGAQIKQTTKIAVTGCPVAIVSHKTSGTTAVLGVKPPAAGRVSASGKNLRTVFVHRKGNGKFTLRASLSSAGVRALRGSGRLTVKVRVGFVPKQKGASSTAFVKVTFRA